MRKAFSLCRLYNKTCFYHSARTTSERVAAVCAVLMNLLLFLLPDHMFLRSFLYINMLVIYSGDNLMELREPRFRVLPVSDRFVLVSVLFMWPAITIGFCAILTGGLVQANALNGLNLDNFLWYILWNMFTEPWFWIALLFLVGCQFSSAAGQFFMDYRKRIIGRIVNIAVFGIASVVYACTAPDVDTVRDASGNMIPFSMRSLQEQHYMMALLIAGCLWVLISAACAYRNGIRFLRHDVTGQKTYDPGIEAASWEETQKNLKNDDDSSGRFVNYLIIGTITMLVLFAVAIGVLCSF